jgi:hypothetical protein
MLGIASPVPYKAVKLIKIKDLVVNSQGCAHLNVPDPSSFAGIYKNTTTVNGQCYVNLRRLKSLSLNLTIVENGDFIDIDTTAEANEGENVGGGAELYQIKVGEILKFRTLTSSDASVTITQNADTIDLVVSGGGGGGEDLAATLVLGNITGGRDIITSDDDVIKAATGDAVLNLRLAPDTWFLGNLTSPTTTNSFIIGSTSALNIGMDAAQQFGLEVKPTSATLGSYDTATPATYFKIQENKAQAIYEGSLPTPTTRIDGVFVCIDSTSSNRVGSSNSTRALFLNSGTAAQSTTINSGVNNSVAVGGYGLTVKTSNTVYVNQISLQFPLNSFDTVLRPSAATADRTISLQDGDGTLAFLNDIPGSYAEDLNSALPSITRVFAGGRTTFTVTHGLNTLDVKPQVYRLSDGRTVNWRIERTGVNTIEASRAGNVADGLFRITI